MPQVMPQQLERLVVNGVALDTDRSAAGSGVTFCFTERTGGVSAAPFASLNLGLKGGDDPVAVQCNRRRVLEALGAPDLADGLVLPNQVHGTEVCVLRDAASRPAALGQGADAVVCTVPDRAVMLLFADCVPVVLVAPGCFAVAHSGWRGTLGGIAGKTARALAAAGGVPLGQVCAYVGPHIGAAAYEVSPELARRFARAFGPGALAGERNLDLGFCVASSLEEAGVPRANVVDCGLCTAGLTDRFFSHRAEHGKTGRHAAVAFMRAGAHDMRTNG